MTQNDKTTGEDITGEDARQRILKTHPHLKDFLPLLDQLNEESERGAVVLSCSFIEDQLRNIIQSFLVDGEEAQKLVEGFNAPLGTFSARATAAYAMGLISKSEHDEIDILRKVRNAFAHNFKATFEDQRTKDLCKNLKFSAQDYEDVVVGSFAQFNTAVAALILSLTNRDYRVAQMKLTPGKWEY